MKRKLHYLTEESFAKLVYDILLRIDFRSISLQIYQTIEAYIFYINSHLKIVKYASSRLEFTQPNIIGFDHLLDIYTHCGDEKVAEAVLATLLSIFRSQLAFTNKTAETASAFYYKVVLGALEHSYQQLVYEDGNRAMLAIIVFAAKLFKEVNSSSSEIYGGLALVENIDILVCDKVG